MDTITKKEKLTVQKQLEIINQSTLPFGKKAGQLKTDELEILQINLGKMCNQTCTHCHVDAGPLRTEIMTKDVLQECLRILHQSESIHTVDLTGGAPEMNPHFKWFVCEVRKISSKIEIIVRSNLTILQSSKYQDFPQFFKVNNLTVVSSLPCYTKENVDKQRGNGVFDRSIKALKTLNNLGYGDPESGLKLHLVYNPGGASIAPSQQDLEKDYKERLYNDFGIVFNQLFTITNLPISRFLEFLVQTNELETYMNKLLNAFNPATLSGVMCRNTLSVGWSGQLYDCDFNQMLELPVNLKHNHIRNFMPEVFKNRTIVTGNHCYGCTAGAGSSCQGALT